ncbi:class I SAM-dependent methyltransferase [Aureivirga sp. CE67]|uniref:class I SAM-dependent methyltransferase n=1 Tax=Aureivirga sp. CE67 TaxID=1788983 RepID=UPI0018C93154|nr:class I SAM-dependent methyltransferase [Aureivirga sp. CE67]
MKEYWDEKFSNTEFAYGEEPNVFIKEKLPTFKTGKILFPAEGEGRNATYAAELGWEVSAFDISTTGKAKATLLANSKNVKIDYQINAMLEEKYSEAEFDAICFSYVHFEPEIKKKMFERLDKYLKKDGHIIFEAFSKEHRVLSMVNPAAGGPPDEKHMYSEKEIEEYFKNYEIIELRKEIVHLEEGFGHNGKSSVIRFIGRKLN